MNGTVVAQCKHDHQKYCKNWDGKGNLDEFNSGGIASDSVKCPSNTKACEFLVTPKPSMPLRP